MQLVINSSGINVLVRTLNHVVNTLPAVRWNTMDTLGRELVVVEREILRDRRFTGELHDAITHEIDTNARTLLVGPSPEAFSDQDKLTGVWKGGRPRWVPIAPLAAWMRRRGLPMDKLHAVRHKIAKVGTSQYQVGRHGSPDWPFPQETLQSAAAQAALRDAANRMARNITVSIGGVP